MNIEIHFLTMCILSALAFVFRRRQMPKVGGEHPPPKARRGAERQSQSPINQWIWYNFISINEDFRLYSDINYAESDRKMVRTQAHRQT